jgi:hypothetical protein
MDILKIFVMRSGLDQKDPGIAVLGQAACYNTARCAGTTWEISSQRDIAYRDRTGSGHLPYDEIILIFFG